ncbi:ammonium transporter [Pelagicoccus albus]|uniref:Ammonium transporter n=1 Tax=Pelagicoccus albus TaxID=415222 RepID=A0A7X1E7X0_9BACT|nr:ammonium transporter [Pelagicoccus albus]MBC2606200.1 ammonium transporter [Pelagicoccus albus]
MKKLLHRIPGLSLLAILAVVSLELTPAMALTGDEAAAKSFFDLSNLWILISAALVFIMHLGFSCVETGLTQSKNTVNILFKNLFIVTMGVLTYALWGFNSMYPGDFNGFFAVGSPIANALDYGDPSTMTAEYADYTIWSDFVFQAMFAATAATIVSGAVAERVKLTTFMIFATLLVMFLYPITGSWKWGGGWLDGKGFYDFAGSSLVHAFGGFAALACVLVLGPRKGKYTSDGKIKPILGHSMPLAAIGVFLLFLGWFGFNGGSVLSADAALVSLVFVTTTIAACAGAMGAIFTSWVVLKKPDLSMGLNGVLAGLVGITAGADQMGPWSAAIVGLIAGVLVVFSIVFFDKIKIDDPVGAISVHGICGMWGTVAVGIFGVAAGEPESYSFIWQLIGTISVSAFAFITSFVLFFILKAVMGVRVSEEEEFGGLDVGEHGQEAYPDFSVSSR